MDTKQPDQDETVEPARSECQHHWVIGPPTRGSSVSKGKCRNCGEERDFPNTPKGPNDQFLGGELGWNDFAKRAGGSDGELCDPYPIDGRVMVGVGW